MAKTSDRLAELKAFDDTKTGVKGLSDLSPTKIPRIFIHPNLHTHPSSSTHVIPIVDLSNPLRSDAARQICAAAETYGMFQVVGHGIARNVFDEMLQGARRFHEQDVEVKKGYYSRDSTKKAYFNSNFDLYKSPAANWRDTLFCLMAPQSPRPEEIPVACR